MHHQSSCFFWNSILSWKSSRKIHLKQNWKIKRWQQLANTQTRTPSMKEGKANAEVSGQLRPAVIFPSPGQPREGMYLASLVCWMNLAGKTTPRCRFSGVQEMFACTYELQRGWRLFIKDPGFCRTQKATSRGEEVVETIKKSKQKRLLERGPHFFFLEFNFFFFLPHPIFASNCYAEQ